MPPPSELAEVEEFRAYVRYANIVTRKESRDKLQSIVDDPIVSVPRTRARICVHRRIRTHVHTDMGP